MCYMEKKKEKQKEQKKKQLCRVKVSKFSSRDRLQRKYDKHGSSLAT